MNSTSPDQEVKCNISFTKRAFLVNAELHGVQGRTESPAARENATVDINMKMGFPRSQRIKDLNNYNLRSDCGICIDCCRV